jgi:hypothetical protein
LNALLNMTPPSTTSGGLPSPLPQPVHGAQHRCTAYQPLFQTSLTGKVQSMTPNTSIKMPGLGMTGNAMSASQHNQQDTQEVFEQEACPAQHWTPIAPDISG